MQSKLLHSSVIDGTQADTLKAHAIKLLISHRPSKALEAARKLRLLDRSAEPHCLQAYALIALNQIDKAQKHVQAANERDPESIQSRLIAGLIHASRGEFLNTEALLFEAEQIDPIQLGKLLAREVQYLPKHFQFYSLDLYLTMALRRLDRCDWRNFHAFQKVMNSYLASLDQIDGGETDRRLLEATYYIETLPQLRLELAKFVANASAKSIVPFAHRPIVEPERLRIAYLVHSFEEGLRTRHIAGIFELHDRSRYEVFVYALDPGDRGEIHSKISQQCDRYTELYPLQADAAARQINQDRIHILIDLTDSGAAYPYELFHHKPAPVQIGYGDGFSSGATSIQYRITDRIAKDALGQDAWVEKLIYVPDSHCLYDTTQQTNAQLNAISREDLGLPKNGLLICAFAPPRLIEPEIFTAWMQILRQQQAAHLWLLDWGKDTRESLQYRASRQGIESDRLHFAPLPSPRNSLLSHLHLADLFLDTQLMNSQFARDALWAGVPVITIAGQSMAQRLTSSQLHALEMEKLVCADVDEYVEKACLYLNRESQLEILQRKLERHVITKPFFHTQQTVLNLEAAYELAWQRFQAGLEPESMQVIAK